MIKHLLSWCDNMSKTKKEEKIPDDSDIMGLSLEPASDKKTKIQIELSNKNLENIRDLALFNNCKVSQLIDFIIEWKIETIIKDCHRDQSFEPMLFYHLIEE